VERVEATRAIQPSAPIYFRIEVEGIAKLIDANTGVTTDVVPIQGSSMQLVIELSQWERLLQGLEYNLPPSHPALAGLPVLDHPTWKDAAKRLENARSHHRSGEDYDALRECLSTLEALVHAPYDQASWKNLLKGLPVQKADGVAELMSGVATYCNRIGHHRDRSERNAAGEFPTMPLEHWEADVVLGAVQFILTYALRLKSAGILVEPVVEAQPPAGAGS